MVTIRELLDTLCERSDESIDRLVELRGLEPQYSRRESLARSYKGDYKQFFEDLLKTDLLKLLSSVDIDGVEHWLVGARKMPKTKLERFALRIYRDGERPAELLDLPDDKAAEEEEEERVEKAPDAPASPGVQGSERHQRIQRWLITVGERGRWFVRSNRDIGAGFKPDVLWYRVDPDRNPNAAPIAAFEIEFGDGQAISKSLLSLLHAHDLATSHLYLIVPRSKIGFVGSKLGGAVHDMADDLRIIAAEELLEGGSPDATYTALGRLPK